MGDPEHHSLIVFGQVFANFGSQGLLSDAAGSKWLEELEVKKKSTPLQKCYANSRDCRIVDPPKPCEFQNDTGIQAICSCSSIYVQVATSHHVSCCARPITCLVPVWSRYVQPLGVTTKTSQGLE